MKRMTAFSVRVAKETLRDPVTLIFGVGLPVALLVLMSIIQRSAPVEIFAISRLAPGMAAFSLAFVAMFAAILLAKDKSTSFLLRVFASPMRPWEYIMGYALPMLPIGAAQCLICFIAALFFGLPFSGRLFLALIAALFLADGFRKRCAAVVQKTCVNLPLLKKMNTSRFAQALSMGISSGLMTEESVTLAAELLRDLPVAAGCKKCTGLLEQGMPLAKALDECQLLPSAQCRMLELGFRSGCEDSVMKQIAAQLEEDAQNALEGALGRIEPTMVLATSVLVGMILLSVMLPLMDIMSTIG